MRKAKTTAAQKGGLIALVGNVQPRKVVPFSKELALRFLRKAYPDAKITITTDEHYDVKNSTYYIIEVKGPSYFLRGSSWTSLQHAFGNLVSSENFRWDAVG